MASKEANISQRRSKPKLQQTSQHSKASSDGFKKAGGHNTSRKKARGRRHSEGELLLPVDHALNHKKKHHNMEKEFGTENKSLPTQVSEPSNLHLVKDDQTVLDGELSDMSTHSSRPPSATPTTDDEGIGISPRSSTGTIDTGGTVVGGSEGNRNSHSKSSSFSSSDCYNILEDEEKEEEEDEIQEEIHSSSDECTSDIINILDECNINAELPENCILGETDSNPDLTLTPTISRPNCGKGKNLQASLKMFPAQHSNTSTGDACSFSQNQPYQVTPEGAMEYAEAPDRLYLPEIGLTRRPLGAAEILREAAVAIVRDNFDRVTQEHERILEHYETTIEMLKKEQVKLRNQYETETKHLSEEILREREQKEKESAKKCDLAAEVGKLQENTREFQQTKDEVEDLKKKLSEKEEELQKLRTTIQARSEKLSPFMPKLPADAEQIEQMEDSAKRLEFLFQIRPNKKTIKDEIQRQNDRKLKRPNTV